VSLLVYCGCNVGVELVKGPGERGDAAKVDKVVDDNPVATSLLACEQEPPVDGRVNQQPESAVDVLVKVIGGPQLEGHDGQDIYSM
jgi:hypothetical protein